MQKKQNSSACSIDISEASGIRYLHFGSDWVQGAMRIAKPWSLELEYTREMLTGLLFRESFDWPRSALQIGLGAGSLSKFIHRHLPNCRSTVVEINPQVEFVARQYFKLPDDPLKLDVCIEDGVSYILRSKRNFDYFILDAFDADAQSGALETLPFYQACRAKLSDQGILAVNFLGRNKGFSARIERLHEAFEGRLIVFPPCKSGNIIAFATRGEPMAIPLETLQQRAEFLREKTSLDLLPTLDRLQSSDVLQQQCLQF